MLKRVTMVQVRDSNSAPPSATPLHFTVGALPPTSGTDLSVEHDVRLTKAALLYADRVKLCSPVASLLILLRELADASDEDKIAALAPWSTFFGGEFAQVYEEIREGLARIRASTSRTARSKQEILALGRLRAGLRRAYGELNEKLNKWATSAGGDGLLRAEEQDLLDIEVLSDLDGLPTDFLAVSRVISSVWRNISLAR